MDLDFLRLLNFSPPVTRRPGPALLLGAGTAFWFVVLVGGDLYLDRVPTLREVAGHFALSLTMSPLAAPLIALKAGWGEERYGRELVIGIVAVVIAGILALWLIGAAAQRS